MALSARKFLIAIAAAVVVVSGLATKARADWVPAEVPEQVRFVMTGNVEEAYELYTVEPATYYELMLDPVTSASPSAAPFVSDGDAFVEVPVATLYGWGFFESLRETHAEIRVYGFMATDPAAYDGARFVVDRIDLLPSAEAEPMSVTPGGDPLGDVDDPIESWVAFVGDVQEATKMTAVWTETGPCPDDDGHCMSGVVVGPDFAGASIQLTSDGYTEDNYPAPTPGRSHTEGQIHLTDLDGSELHLNFSGEKEFTEPAALYYAWVYHATGRFAEVGTEGTFVFPAIGGGPPSLFSTGAGVGELILW